MTIRGRVLAVALLLAVASGCKIVFEAETMVAPDGSLTRTTRYVADEDSDKEEVETLYALPVGGLWGTRKGPKVEWALWEKRELKEGTLHAYEVTQRYAPMKSIPADYVRKGASGRSSQNDVSVRVRDYFFVKDFHYEERFRDVTTLDVAIRGIEKFYAAWIEHFAGQLQLKLNEAVTLGQARAALRGTLDPVLTKVLEGLRNEGKAPLGGETFEKELAPLLDTEAMVARVVEALPPPSVEQAEQWKETIGEAYNETGNFDWKQTGLEEDICGVYGCFDLTSHSFKASLSLPGKIVQANAQTNVDNVLSWKFEPGDFLWEDYVLKAQSRLIYPVRIAAGSIVALLGFIAVIWSALRRRPKGLPADGGGVTT